MQVIVTRRGGLAGIAIRGTCDTSDFPGSEEALRTLRVSDAPPQPDAFTYELTFNDQSVSATDAELGDALRMLCYAAVSKGDII